VNPHYVAFAKKEWLGKIKEGLWVRAGMSISDMEAEIILNLYCKLRSKKEATNEK